MHHPLADPAENRENTIQSIERIRNQFSDVMQLQRHARNNAREDLNLREQQLFTVHVHGAVELGVLIAVAVFQLYFIRSLFR